MRLSLFIQRETSPNFLLNKKEFCKDVHSSEMYTVASQHALGASMSHATGFFAAEWLWLVGVQVLFSSEMQK